MDYAIEVDVAAPPGTVWAVMADVERWHEWTASISSIELLDGRPLGVGSRAKVRQPRFPPAVWEVTAFEPGRGFTWQSRGPWALVTGHHYVEPTPTGSRARLAIHFEGVVAKLVARLTWTRTLEYVQLEAAGLKRRAEGHG